MADATKWSEQKRLADRHVYMEYAGWNQDVFAGYGPANQERLRNIGKMYDLQGIFQKLLPGGKKLF